MMRFVYWAYGIGLSMAFVLITLMLMAESARAERECIRHTVIWRHGSCNAEWGFTCRPGHWRRVCVRWAHTDYDEPYRRYDPRPERVYAYERRDYEIDRSVDRSAHCLAPVRREGAESYGNDKAKENAEAMWMEAVRRHHGSKYMDLKNARRVIYDCSRSSTGNRASEKTNEVVGRYLEQCTVEATPCRGRPQAREEDR